MTKHTYLFLLVLIIFACSKKQTLTIENRKGVLADSAMVVSAHPLASKVGAEILKKGGNAIDAAVAVHFALAVVYPSAGNIGGGGFMVYRSHDGEYHTLDYREMAPASASRDMYLDNNGNVDQDKSRYGHHAAGVPGSVDGMVTVHERFGSMEWNELLQPAIELARDGFTLTSNEARYLNANQENFKTHNTVLPSNLIHDQWNEGDTIYYKDLAKTLTRIAIDKRSGFYGGETASLIVEEMKRGGGLISLEDLSNYTSVWRDPISFTYKDCRVTSMGPPSSGGVALAQLMNIVQDFPLDMWGINNMRSIHMMVEAEKLVYADRASYLGDPDFYEVPVSSLLDSAYLRKRAESINIIEARKSSELQAGVFLSEHEETTHFSIVDPFGNAVSSTTTLNGGYGNKVVVGSAGFFLNNEMDDFSAKPGSPNMYGLIGGEANAIVPGKRMLSSMTPTIVERDGRLFMIVGSPGGSTIITSVFQVMINVIDHGLNMQGAVDFPRFHHQWVPDVIQYEEKRFNEDIIQSLTELGHQMKVRDPYGKVDAILVSRLGVIEGAADPRGDDTAVGF